jgi:four helix bundle protein
MKDFRDLAVWQKAHALALIVYRLSGGFPREELYGVTSQIRRATLSVPTNLAEGCGRGSDLDFARFVQMAMGSACELEYLLLLAKDLRFLSPTSYQPVIENLVEIKRMLAALLKKLKADR